MELSPEEMKIRPRTAFAWIHTEEELIQKLQSISVPMLMIAATEDKIISANAMLRSACAVPGAKTVFYQGAGHGVAFEGEFVQDVHDEILLFLNKKYRKEELVK